MKKSWIIATVVVVVLVVLINSIIYISYNLKSGTEIEGLEEKIQTTTSVVPDNVLNYLQSQNSIGKTYGEKKIAIYYTGNDFPYVKTLTEAVKSLENDEELSSKYFFHPEADARSKFFMSQAAAQAYIDFHEMCGSFCILNPDKKQIMKIEMDKASAEAIPAILTQFKDW